MAYRRDEIEKFCRNFLHGNSGHQQLHELIGNYEREFSQIDIKQLFTKDTFEAVHKHHCSSSWYTIDILTNSLVNVLEGVGFHPEELAPSRCVIL